MMLYTFKISQFVISVKPKNKLFFAVVHLYFMLTYYLIKPFKKFFDFLTLPEQMV